MATGRTVLVDESPIEQGVLESMTYTIRVKNATTVTSPTTTAYDEGETDVSASVLSGSASVSGTTITLPTVYNLTADQEYRIVTVAIVNGNTQSFVLVIEAVNEKTIG